MGGGGRLQFQLVTASPAHCCVAIWNLKASLWLSTCGRKNKGLCNGCMRSTGSYMYKQESPAGCGLKSDTHGSRQRLGLPIKAQKFLEEKLERGQKPNNLLTISSLNLKKKVLGPVKRKNFIQRSSDSTSVRIPSTRKLRELCKCEITCNFSTWESEWTAYYPSFTEKGDQVPAKLLFSSTPF